MNNSYDIFISFKNSTEEGLTEDREVAQKMYAALTDRGLNVFFSNSVLPDKGVANYMMEIQSALESAKAILVIYSRVEYIEEGWVAQEWMTFLNLVMKDPSRKIYVYSIYNDMSRLPAFLRPYECFGDFKKAVSHIDNGLKGTESEEQAWAFGKREFLNAYWNLFGTSDIYDYLEKPLLHDFYNHRVYCLKTAYLAGGDKESYIRGLEKEVEKKDNPLAGYLLGQNYREVDSLDLQKSTNLRKNAFRSFQTKIATSFPDSEVGLFILTDREEYDGAFFLCDLLHDVLDAYGVKTDIQVLRPDRDRLSLGSRRKTVLFWSDVLLEFSEEFLGDMEREKENLLVCFNAFGEGALPYSLHGFTVFENNNTDLTKICRTLLS